MIHDLDLYVGAQCMCIQHVSHCPLNTYGYVTGPKHDIDFSPNVHLRGSFSTSGKASENRKTSAVNWKACFEEAEGSLQRQSSRALLT